MKQTLERNRSELPDVIVIGAGLCGSCIALELARKGLRVALMDQDPLPMNRAGRRNEGKIHLGLIYAADRSFSTAELQLKGALSFFNLLRRWLGDDVNRIERSTPFTYLVAEDSILSADALAAHYEKVEKAYHRHLSLSPGLNYLGNKPDFIARQIDPDRLDKRLNGNRVSAAFSTSELAIDTDALADLIVGAVRAEPRIKFYPHLRARGIAQAGEFFLVYGDSREEEWSLSSMQVVNASWEGRLALDASLGLIPPQGWLYRLKYRVLAHASKQLADAPSVTMVLGRYGDVVIRSRGSVYLSWYPSGLRGWSDTLETPPDWNTVCSGGDAMDSSLIIDQIFSGITSWYPDVGLCNPYQVDAGVIVAYGQSDVDDPTSGLHDRTRIGVSSTGRYHSVDPGKLTTAPLFAMETAERVVACLEG